VIRVLNKYRSYRWATVTEGVAEVMQVNVELPNSSVCQGMTDHEDLDDIPNSGLRASRFSSGGECHVPGSVGLGAGLGPCGLGGGGPIVRLYGLVRSVKSGGI